MSADEKVSRDFFFTRFVYSDYERVFTAIFPPMTYLTLFCHALVYALIMISLTISVTNNPIVILSLQIYFSYDMIKILYGFFYVKAQYYVMKKKSNSGNGFACLKREFFLKRLNLAKYSTAYTLVQPPISWLKFAKKSAVFVLAIMVLVIFKLEELFELQFLNLIKKQYLQIILVKLSSDYILFLFEFFVPEAKFVILDELKQQDLPNISVVETQGNLGANEEMQNVKPKFFEMINLADQESSTELQ
jgi:hypothetical protein